MQVYSHRGSVEAGVENTLQAFDHAVNMGAGGIEFDVRLCGSGELILMHDSTLWRTDHKFIPICITSLDKLRKQCSYHIPTLDEVLERYIGKCVLILDLKDTRLRGSELESKVVNTLKEYEDKFEKIVLSTDSYVSLSKLSVLMDNFLRKKVELALIIDGRFRITTIMSYFSVLDAIHLDRKLVRKSNVRFWKGCGVKVRVWTVNSEVEAIKMANLGIDGIFTDNIALFTK